MGRAEDLFEQLMRDGEAAIDRLIADRAAEELFLDFKRSADEGKGTKLHDRDRNNLARNLRLRQLGRWGTHLGRGVQGCPHR
jgi:hypothetical protein